MNATCRSPVGRLSLALLAGQTEDDLRRLAQEDQTALSEEGLAFGPAQFTEAEARVGEIHGALVATVMQSNAAIGTARHERVVVTSRLGQDHWLYADCISRTRQSGPEQWAMSKQAFAILLKQLRIG